MIKEPVREAHISINQDVNVLVASQHGRTLAAMLGFTEVGQAAVAIAISEVARNILNYAGQGDMVLCPIEQDARQGISVVAWDQGPGIPDVNRAMQDGYTTGKGLGLGLPGAKRLMDEFEIVSEVGKGTTIMMKKWKR
jgi:serine/threonine-protein kinase RsbT